MLAPGFADPVFEGQAVFRALLDALARPAGPVALPTELAPPAPLTPELAAVALALADSDAALWLDEALAASADVVAFLRFHTGAPIVADPADAAFALMIDLASLLPLDRFALGTEEYPDRATTIVVATPKLDGDHALSATGPGIDGEVAMGAPLPTSFPAAWSANGALFPRGIDLILVAPGLVMGLPRSTHLAEAT